MANAKKLNAYRRLVNAATEWSRTGMVSSALRPYVAGMSADAASGKDIDRGFWLGEVLDEIKRAARRDLDNAEISALESMIRLASAPTKIGWIVMEFHGKGDRISGGGADDRVLGKNGAFLTGSHSRADYGVFPSESAALRAGEVASNRRRDGKLLVLPK